MTPNEVFCQCVEILQTTPGADDVLETVRRNTVCTGEQCFESETDAFGTLVPPSGSIMPSWAGILAMTALWVWPAVWLGLAMRNDLQRGTVTSKS